LSCPGAGAKKISICSASDRIPWAYLNDVRNGLTSTILKESIMKDDQATGDDDGVKMTMGLRFPGRVIGPQVGLECIPVVTAIDPPQSLVLRDITISGQKFQPTATTCGSVDIPPVVTFLDSHPGGPLVAAVRSFTDTQIVARVPNGAKTGFIAVSNTKGIVSPIPGALTVLPAIDSFSPTQGGVGTAVRVNGTALYNTPQFFFQGKDGAQIPAAFSNPSLTSILVAVPPGAVTGPISVMTKGGGTARTATSVTVTAATPEVGDCAPRFGAPGTRVAIFAKAGTKFEAIRSVRFLTDPDALGRARRIVLAPSEFAVSGDMTRIDVLVPFGSVTGKIRVTNDTGAGASPVFRVPLASPASLIARTGQGAQVTPTWRDATTTESGFRLERTSGEADGGYTVIATLPPNTVSFSDTSVTSGLTYRYRLFAFNSSEGDSAPSNPAIVTVGTSVQLTPGRMQFGAVRDSANPPLQPLAIARAASAQMEQAFSISDDAPWLTVLPASGMTPGTVMVGVDTFGLKAGRYVGVITVRSGNPATVISAAVELMVTAPAGAISVVVEPDLAFV
jgi:hypothetical protein